MRMAESLPSFWWYVASMARASRRERTRDSPCVAAAVATTDSIPGSLPRTPSRVANAVCSVGVNQVLRSRSRTVRSAAPSPMSLASFSFVRSIGGLFQTEWRIVSSNEYAYWMGAITAPSVRPTAKLPANDAEAALSSSGRSTGLEV